MTTESLFSIRDAAESDLPAINAMSAAEGMGAAEATDVVFVAVNADGEAVGFIRLAHDEEQGWHINPVVVYPTWRRHGVGKALVAYALDRFGELRLVSRGTSRAFYEALGFEAVPWEMVSPPIAAECDGCEAFGECSPVPMRKKRTP